MPTDSKPPPNPMAEFVTPTGDGGYATRIPREACNGLNEDERSLFAAATACLFQIFEDHPEKRSANIAEALASAAVSLTELCLMLDWAPSRVERAMHGLQASGIALHTNNKMTTAEILEKMAELPDRRTAAATGDSLEHAVGNLIPAINSKGGKA